MSTTTEPLVLRIERTFNASRDRLFAAWTNPEIIRQWSAPAGAIIEEGEGEVVVDGRWRVVMLNTTTGERYIAMGAYLEVVPPSRLRYTHAWQQPGESFEQTMTRATIVTIEIHHEGERTRMVFVQEGFESAGSRDGHSEGWTSCFEQLERLLS